MKDANKVALREKFTALNTYGRKAERYKFNDFCCNLKKVEKEEQSKITINKWKEIIKNKRFNKVEKRQTEKNETKFGLWKEFKNVKPIARQMEKEIKI